MPKSSVQTSKTHRAKKIAQGYVQRTYWIRKGNVIRVKAFVDKIDKGEQ